MAQPANPIRSSRIADVVTEAILLNRSIRQNEERLKELKAQLRKEAEKVAKKRSKEDKDEMVEFESPQGTATVCFVKDTVALIDGADPRVLRGEIRDEVWDILFDEQVVLAKDFESKLTALPKPLQAKVKPLIDWFPNAPRVNLPK